MARWRRQKVQARPRQEWRVSRLISSWRARWLVASALSKILPVVAGDHVRPIPGSPQAAGDRTIRGRFRTEIFRRRQGFGRNRRWAARGLFGQLGGRCRNTRSKRQRERRNEQDKFHG